VRGRAARARLHVACVDFKGPRCALCLGKARTADAEGGRGRRRGAGRFQHDRFDLGHFDQVFLPKLELKCIEG
jgi:hypothetical protein